MCWSDGLIRWFRGNEGKLVYPKPDLTAALNQELERDAVVSEKRRRLPLPRRRAD